jgi:hypothetical protein
VTTDVIAPTTRGRLRGVQEDPLHQERLAWT